MQRIAIDMDDVLADTQKKMFTWAREILGDGAIGDIPPGREFLDLLPPKEQILMKAAMQSPDFFADIPVMAGSRAVVRELHKHYEIFVASAAMEFPNSFGAKFKWLRKNFDWLDPMHFVFCGDKAILQADFLIDDRARHFRRFTGQGILFSAPHNLLVEGYVRVSSWDEAGQLLLSAPPYGGNREKDRMACD